ncbi:15537_t:CDS:2 [Gigaspora margarita]|uniref:15537_t:CDS:1 n=1 Tax=Gigaspora margarita TaxID=4874 RepID=A0ABN7VU48_GIGMA|nr:15537_t:CDS:2 [Gigaspora margarita]
MSQTIEDITLTGNRQSPHYNNITTTQTIPPDITHPLEYFNEQKAHIISMTETKWPESTTPYISLTNPLYKIYIVNCDAETAIQKEASMGTALALYPDLQPYIHNIDKPIKLGGTNTTTFSLTPNKLQDNVTNVINDTSNSTQSKEIRTQTAETCHN